MNISENSRKEALRYLGCGNATPDGKTLELVEICAKRLETAAAPKYLSRRFKIEECPVPLIGNDIAAHLDGCSDVIIFAATLGVGVDKLIRTEEITGMAEAVILDALASAAIEQFCREADELIHGENPDMYMTWRYSAGYGDYPIETQRELLTALMADKKIGLCLSDSMILTPRKSVTAIIGLSDKEIPKKRRGCAVCNMIGTCPYRAKGEHCGF